MLMPSADHFVIDSGPDLARWPMLVAAIERLTRARSFEAVVEVLRRSTRALVDAEGFAFFLVEGKQVRCIAEDGVNRLWPGQSLNASDCICGWAIRNRSTALVRDINADPRVPPELYATTSVRSTVAVPVGDETLVGAISVYWTSPNAATGGGVQILEHLARATSAALGNIALIDARRHAEEWLALALEAEGTGAWRYEPESGAFDASASFKAMFGRGADEPFGYFDMLQAIHPDDRAAAVGMRDRAIGSRGDYQGVFRAVRPDGTVRSLRIRAKVCRDSAGRPMALIGVARDVTGE